MDAELAETEQLLEDTLEEEKASNLKEQMATDLKEQKASDTVADPGGFQRFPLKPPLLDNIICIGQHTVKNRVSSEHPIWVSDACANWTPTLGCQNHDTLLRYSESIHAGAHLTLQQCSTNTPHALIFTGCIIK